MQSIRCVGVCNACVLCGVARTTRCHGDEQFQPQESAGWPILEVRVCGWYIWNDGVFIQK